MGDGEAVKIRLRRNDDKGKRRRGGAGGGTRRGSFVIYRPLETLQQEMWPFFFFFFVCYSPMRSIILLFVDIPSQLQLHPLPFHILVVAQ